MTVDEFLAWAEGRPGHHELDGGIVVAMSPESVGHLRVERAACDALAAAIRRAGLPCAALPDGATVRVDRATAHEPDALVYCGPALSRDVIEVPSPVIVIDVLSPSTRRHDQGGKLIGYFAVPGLHHYLIVDADRRVVIHHARREDHIATHIRHGGDIRLDPPGIEVRVEDLFGAPTAGP